MTGSMVLHLAAERGRGKGVLPDDLADNARFDSPSPPWGEGRVRGALQEDLAHYARELRRAQTDAERTLWAQLRGRRLALKFRRQHPIGPYIVDFCCPERRLIVELDGSQHALRRDEDAARSRFFRLNGYRVLRFWNPDVFGNLDGILERIDRALRAPLPGRESGSESGRE
jgi:very-short-patch-repair endonuclease